LLPVLIIYSLKCAHLFENWKCVHNFFETPAFLHMQVVKQTAVIIS